MGGDTQPTIANQSYSWSVPNTDSDSVAASLGSISLTDPSNGLDAIASITAAIETVTAQRAEYGAMQNRLQYTVSNLMNVSEQTQVARSRIEDADFAIESAKLAKAKAKALQQAGTAMLSQEHAHSQTVLSLVKRVL